MNESEIPPPKMVGLAKWFAKKVGWSMPADLEADRNVCRTFMEDAKREAEIRAMEPETKRHIRRIQSGVLIQDAPTGWEANPAYMQDQNSWK